MPHLLRGRERWSVILEQLKYCPSCKEVKHVSEFHRNVARRSGIHCYCKPCQNAKNAARSLNRWENNDLRWVAGRIHSNTRISARRRGLIYELSPEWFLAKLEAGICELTGLPLGRYASRDPHVPSPDRLDNDIGYTDENTRVILWWINQAKNNWPEDVFQSLMREYAEAMYEHA